MLIITRKDGEAVWIGQARVQIAVDAHGVSCEILDRQGGHLGTHDLPRERPVELVPDVSLTYLRRVGYRGARIGIDAPKAVPVKREELLERDAARGAA